ncbi:cell division protein FtsQ/DivIB [Sideroxydans sp. CL21]|uniref:cell division protein FtsQ/DivIB n=1 Tax=Sideroxydans sp. CL21 TaxID=2600596 RepID=UPI0012A8E44E|nr:cell division protein FtsQ/DivIB [Sideroxydans sp. CL21]VVC85423.1 Cell division protein FtsQ [Sideroxydans sp. CL21]
MWDNTPLLRGIANVLFGASFVLVLYGTARYVLHLPVFPLRIVELTAVPQRISPELMEKVVHEQVSGNFFTVDLEATRQAFEKLPWVRKVSVRRKFPWSLEVEVEEQVALARWNGTSLVNTYGEVFSATTDQVLPVFIGQPETSPQVTQMYADLNAALQPLHQQIVQISLSPRYAWQVKLDKGMVLELGREEMQERMTRFVKVYPYSLAALARPANHVDLRYRNGFAAYLPGGNV